MDHPPPNFSHIHTHTHTHIHTHVGIEEVFQDVLPRLFPGIGWCVHVNGEGEAPWHGVAPVAAVAAVAREPVQVRVIGGDEAIREVLNLLALLVQKYKY